MITLVVFLLVALFVILALLFAIGLGAFLGFLGPAIEIGLVLLVIWVIYKVFFKSKK